MASEWINVKFGDSAQRVSDVVQPDRMAERTPYIGLEHIVEGGLHLNGQSDASEATSAKTRFHRGDILFGKLRPYFRKVVRPMFDGICSTDIWAVRARNGVDQGFLFYRMASAEFVDKSMEASTGTRMPRADWGFLSQWEMPLPPLAEQKAIASILGAMDDKIELTRRMNATLEAMARALFQSWFVDFDPVRAKLDGRKPEGMDKATAALFPEHLEDSPLGHIPKGWEVGVLGNLAEVQGGFAFKSQDFMDAGSPVVKIKNIGDDHTVNVDDVEYVPTDLAKQVEDFQLSDGDVLMAMTGAKVAKFGLLVNREVRAVLNQRVARFIPRSHLRRPWFVYCSLLDANVLNQIVTRAEGSAQPNVSATGIKSARLVCPGEAVVDRFNEIVHPLFASTLKNIGQSRTLATLRDTLLPKLLSGELSVAAIPKGTK